MATKISWDGDAVGDVSLDIHDRPVIEMGHGETTDWIAQRNAQLGLVSEFDQQGGAQPEPLGFVFQPQPEEQAQMRDDFYDLYVLGIRDWRVFRMTPPKQEAFTVYQQIESGLQIVKWGNL